MVESTQEDGINTVITLGYYYRRHTFAGRLMSPPLSPGHSGLQNCKWGRALVEGGTLPTPTPLPGLTDLPNPIRNPRWGRGTTSGPSHRPDRTKTGVKKGENKLIPLQRHTLKHIWPKIFLAGGGIKRGVAEYLNSREITT